jgi:Undecaprenyl-phosphate glucose phosphotransferase
MPCPELILDWKGCNVMIRKHQRFLNSMQASLDATTLLLAYAGSIFIKLASPEFTLISTKYIIGPVWMVPLLLLAYKFMHAYTPMRSRTFRKEVLIVTRAHVIGIVIIFSVLFLHKSQEFSREISVLFAGFGVVFVLLQRYLVRRALRYLRQKGYNQKHMLILGAGPVGQDFARKVREHRDFGYRVVGFLDDDEAKQETSVLGKPVLGGCEKLSECLQTQAIDEVVVALPVHAYARYSRIIEICEKAGIRIRIIPDYNKFLPCNIIIEEFDGIPVLNVRNMPLDDPFNRFIKRLFDICFSTVALVITGPLMILIAIGVKLTSPGPVFFRQERVGLNNRRFNMLKFRSMRVDTDQVASTTWTTADDPRKTRFGTFLRKTSLDELPQFINVFMGNMSVVGPRPERPYFVEQFKEEIPKYMVKHQVKPGITGLAQVNGWRGDTSIQKRIECDIDYIENWDPLFDLKIVFLTVFKGLVNKNAY